LRLAAVASGSGSGGIGFFLHVRFEGFDSLDDPDQVELHGRVHLDQPLVAVALGVGEQSLGALELLAVEWQELVGGEEVVAGQAGVRVLAGLLER
jgi:hypothetical protein